MVRQIILAGLVVFLPAGAQAQGRGGMPAVSHTVGVAPRVVMQAPHAGTAQAMPGTRTRTVTRGGAVRPRAAAPAVRGARPQNTTRRRFDGEDGGLRSDCSSAPGLGFDAVHQAATCGSGTMGLRGRGFQEPFFFPIFDGGFSVPSSPVAAEDGSAVEAQQPESTDAEVRETDRRYRTPQPVPAAETASSAASNNEEFVFVRRDGTVFFAVAYAWEKGTLRYITSQGLRHTVTQDTLDLDATRQFNEQRGLNFHSPA